jgi:hypothetical protein
MAAKLTDEEVYDRLHEAYLALGKEQAETVAGATTIQTARLALQSLQQGFLMAIDSDSDENSAILGSSQQPDP